MKQPKMTEQQKLEQNRGSSKIKVIPSYAYNPSKHLSQQDVWNNSRHTRVEQGLAKLARFQSQHQPCI